MSKILVRGGVAALGLLIGLPTISSAHAHYTGVAPASVKAALVSTSAHAKVTTVKHKKKHKKHKKSKAAHKSVHKSALHSKASAHTKHRSSTNA